MGLRSESRKQAILDLLKENPHVAISELAQEFSVSEVTLRRDLAALARAGKILRTYGGAVRSQGVLYEFSFNEKLRRNIRQKEAIGKLAATLIQDGDTVLLDTGTTTLQIAKSLADRHHITVITASLPIVSALAHNTGVTTILLGGELQVGGYDLVGPVTERQLQEIRVDKCFQGADGIDAQEAYYTTDFKLARVAQLMTQVAQETIIVADHTKFARRSLVPFARIEEADRIITSEGIEQGVVDVLTQKGVEVVVTPQRGETV